jgi:hypothetical protein
MAYLSGKGTWDRTLHLYDSYAQFVDDHSPWDDRRDTCTAVLWYHKVKEPEAQFGHNCMTDLRTWLLCNYRRRLCGISSGMCDYRI